MSQFYHSSNSCQNMILTLSVNNFFHSTALVRYIVAQLTGKMIYMQIHVSMF